VAKTSAGRSALTLVSLYGLIDGGYADTTVNRQLSDLTPLFDDPAHEKRLILGGDLNITTQWTGSQKRYGVWEAVTLNRIAAFGLVDCLNLHRSPGILQGCGCREGDQCRHIQTQRHSRSKRPWQNDYIFASAALIPNLSHAHVHDSGDIRTLGDHMPLVADFSL
jgi:endonuclease/exonuclease/phosphatase family metal-dependent hydrolase